MESPAFPASSLALELSEQGSVLVASVFDSDYCELAATRGGELAWEWVFGEPPIPGAHRDEDVSRENDAARGVASRIANWAVLCGLPTPNTATVASAVDRGYTMAEDGLGALLGELGLTAKAVPSRAAQPAPHLRQLQRSPNYPDQGRRYWALRVDTYIDLYDRVHELADWLNTARQLLMTPVFDSYPPDLIRWSIDPHGDYGGPPDGLIVLTHGWSSNNRPRFGSGDDAGWTRKTRQLLRGELRAIDTKADSLDDTGRAHRTLGMIAIGAVLRDQFVTDGRDPLPAEHPACVYVCGHADPSRRGWPTAPLDVLVQLANDAVGRFDASGGFIEPGRPEYTYQGSAIAPISPTFWSYGELSDGLPASYIEPK